MGNTMAAVVLVTQGAKTSAAMLLTKFLKYILISAPEKLKFEALTLGN